MPAPPIKPCIPASKPSWLVTASIIVSFILASSSVPATLPSSLLTCSAACWPISVMNSVEPVPSILRVVLADLLYKALVASSLPKELNGFIPPLPPTTFITLLNAKASIPDWTAAIPSGTATSASPSVTRSLKLLFKFSAFNLLNSI